jgi:hypothetical protein
MLEQAKGVLLALAVVGAAGVQALVRVGPWPALLGARGLAFLVLAFGAGIFVDALLLKAVSRALAACLLIQLLLGTCELLYGLPLNGYLPWGHLPRRIAGTLVLPNSLGVFASCATAFALTFGEGWSRTSRRALWGASLLLIVASGSGAGLLGMVVLVVALAMRWQSQAVLRPIRIVAFLALIAVLLLAMPWTLSRPRLWESVESRIDKTLTVVGSGEYTAILFGHGLGFGSNAALQGQQLAERSVLPADSTPILLVREIGVLGTALVYLILLSAWLRDVQARTFYAVAIVTSLASNVLELFPVNLLLGLALARTTWSVAAAAPTNGSRA